MKAFKEQRTEIDAEIAAFYQRQIDDKAAAQAKLADDLKIARELLAETLAGYKLWAAAEQGTK